LKKLIHGTTGYMNQVEEHIISSKFIEKETKSEQFKNSFLFQFNNKHFHVGEKVYSELLGTRTSRNLIPLEKLFFESNFNLNLDAAITGDRVKFKGRVYHSTNYSRRGKLNSYTISYKKNNKKKYGIIEHFIEHNENFYAFIKKLKIKEELSLPVSSGIFNEFVQGELMKKYYRLLVKSTDFFFI